MHQAGECFLDLAVDYARAWQQVRGQCAGLSVGATPVPPEVIVAVTLRLAAEPVDAVRVCLLERLVDELIASLRVP